MRKLEHQSFIYLRLINSALSTLAGFFLIILLGLTVADVISRNFFGASILGMIEISTLLLIGIAFLGLAQGEVDGRHVSLSLIEERLSGVIRAGLSWIRLIILVSLAIFMTWGMSNAVTSALARSEATNDVLALPTWPAKTVVLVSFIMFFIIAIAREAMRAKSKNIDATWSSTDA